jgi:hypothetical protein
MRHARIVMGSVLATALFVACGSRTGLLEPRPDTDAGVDASIVDAASEDAPVDVVKDSPVDVTIDALEPCDPLALFVYLVTSQKDLYRYDPSNGSLTLVGKLKCPSLYGSPFSMGVGRNGIAYVLYSQLGAPGVTPPGELFAVSVADAACVKTDFVPGQHDFNLFGMGFALDDDGLGETLYVADIKWQQGSLGLASINLDNFELSPIGPLEIPLDQGMELTSSDDGQLYGYALDAANGGNIVRIDKSTAKVLETTPLNVTSGSSALAFAYWGGDFYTFTAQSNGPTTITRYSPADASVKVMGTISNTVVGAGVTTCKVK